MSHPCPPNGTFGRIQQVGILNPERFKGKRERAGLSGSILVLSSARNLYILCKSKVLRQKNPFNVNVINTQCSLLNSESLSIFQVRYLTLKEIKISIFSQKIGRQQLRVSIRSSSEAALSLHGALLSCLPESRQPLPISSVTALAPTGL